VIALLLRRYSCALYLRCSVFSCRRTTCRLERVWDVMGATPCLSTSEATLGLGAPLPTTESPVPFKTRQVLVVPCRRTTCRLECTISSRSLRFARVQGPLITVRPDRPWLFLHPSSLRCCEDAPLQRDFGQFLDSSNLGKKMKIPPILIASFFIFLLLSCTFLISAFPFILVDPFV